MAKSTKDVQTIVWMHGWGTSAMIWLPYIERLPEYNHRLIDYRDCHEADDFPQTCLQLLQSLEGPVTIVAWSLGGMVALETLLTHIAIGEHVRQIVIIGSTLCFVDSEKASGWPKIVLQRMKKNISNGRSLETLAAFRERVLAPCAIPQAHRLLAQDDFSMQTLLAGLDYLITRDLRPLWLERGEFVRARLYWIHGTEDDVCPLRALPANLLHAPNLWEGVGHAPHLRDENRFYNQLKKWLSLS